jgi:hypothetical protein
MSWTERNDFRDWVSTFVDAILKGHSSQNGTAKEAHNIKSWNNAALMAAAYVLGDHRLVDFVMRDDVSYRGYVNPHDYYDQFEVVGGEGAILKINRLGLDVPTVWDSTLRGEIGYPMYHLEALTHIAHMRYLIECQTDVWEHQHAQHGWTIEDVFKEYMKFIRLDPGYEEGSHGWVSTDYDYSRVEAAWKMQVRSGYAYPSQEMYDIVKESNRGPYHVDTEPHFGTRGPAFRGYPYSGYTSYVSPQAPTSLAVDSNGRSYINISWTQRVENEDFDVCTWVIEVDGTEVGRTNLKQYSISGLASGVGHSIRVTSLNECGETATSSTLQALTQPLL